MGTNWKEVLGATDYFDAIRFRVTLEEVVEKEIASDYEGGSTGQAIIDQIIKFGVENGIEPRDISFGVRSDWDAGDYHVYLEACLPRPLERIRGELGRHCSEERK